MTNVRGGLIADDPSDTLHRCADVAVFLRQVITQPETEPADLHIGPKAKEGFFWIMAAVEDALRYEAERVSRKPAAE